MIAAIIKYILGRESEPSVSIDFEESESEDGEELESESFLCSDFEGASWHESEIARQGGPLAESQMRRICDRNRVIFDSRAIIELLLWDELCGSPSDSLDEGLSMRWAYCSLVPHTPISLRFRDLTGHEA